MVMKVFTVSAIGIVVAMFAPGAMAAVVDGGEPWDTELVVDHGDTRIREFVFSAEPGERNRVLVRRRGSNVLFADPGAKRLTVEGYGCVQLGPHTARCRASSSEDSPDYASNVAVRVHAGNDRVVVAESVGLFASVYGGSGEDRISVGVDAQVFAGPGNDRVTASVMDEASGVFCGSGRDRYRGPDTDLHGCEIRTRP